MRGLFDAPQAANCVRYISHRGFQPLAPANSLPSFIAAGRLRQWAIETDVHFTRDGAAVCCHNDTVDETYNGAGAIRDMTLKDIRALRIRTGNRLDCFAPEELRMPLFSEYLAICKKYGSVPFIELKTLDAERVAREVDKAGFDPREVVYSAVGLDKVLAARKAAPQAFIHLIFGTQEDVPTLAEAGNAGMSYNIKDPFACDPALIRYTQASGVRVCLRAGDTLAGVARMLSLGLDYVPSNCMFNPD